MLAPIEQHMLLASKVSAKYRNGHKIQSGSVIEVDLRNIMNENIEEFLHKKGYSLQDKSKYLITKKDPYLLLNPKRENKKNETLSQRKFEFFWDYFDMNNFVPEQLLHKPQNYLYDALKSFIYKDNQVNGDLGVGHYILKRMSLNSHFKGYISVIRLWVFKEKNVLGEDVLCYKAINAYDQSGSESSSPFKRIRLSKGYVIKNQYNTLLFGGIDYSHISELEGDSSTNHYPEIISLHTASPHSKIFLGFSLANYPDYQKPSLTQCYIEKIDYEAYPTFEGYFKDKPWEKVGDNEAKDKVIGTRKPNKYELKYLTLILDNSSHKQILLPEISELVED